VKRHRLNLPACIRLLALLLAAPAVTALPGNDEVAAI
jgi:hypothetical protein